MKRGRKPTPLALEIARGNPSRRTHEPELELKPGVPEKPKFAGFDKGAAAEWERVVEEMVPGVISRADQQILAGYCCAISLWHRALKRAAATKDPRDEDRALRAFEYARKAGALFGLGPAERVRVRGPRQGANPSDERRRRFFGDGHKAQA